MDCLLSCLPRRPTPYAQRSTRLFAQSPPRFDPHHDITILMMFAPHLNSPTNHLGESVLDRVARHKVRRSGSRSRSNSKVFKTCTLTKCWPGLICIGRTMAYRPSGAFIANSRGMMWHPSMAWSMTLHINMHEKVDERLYVIFLSTRLRPCRKFFLNITIFQMVQL